MNCNIILKLVNVVLAIFFYRQYVKNSVKDEDQEEIRDVNKWYTLIEGRTRYKGEWKNGRPHGKGIKEYFKTSESDYCLLDCNFVNGIAEGCGTMTYEFNSENGEFYAPYYQGEIRNNNQNGYGCYYFGDGSYRMGEYEDGKSHGKGIYYNSVTGSMWIGIYENDKRLSGMFCENFKSKCEIFKPKCV